ncbi:hypothetical protein SI65_06183 [Aspergillus cristatus]|uniref:Protein SQS1 n=1 Tax=Aspergillus cristatus TaxID=573508 RepID=A0A1E3BBG9_ASPCR|nr:hypothetical protein SI65_06183 [Aspergillus cristatus]
MQQAARNTEDRNIWLPSSQLRHKAVHFVRGGDLEPEETENKSSTTPEQEPCESTPKTELDIEKDDIPPDNEDTPHELSFFIDRSSQSIAPTGLPNPVSRLRSLSPDDSSGDEIVFHGRNRYTDQNNSSQYPTTIDDEFEPQSSETPVTIQNLTLETSIEAGHSSTTRRDGQTVFNRESTKYDENDILADYIANIDVDYEETDTSSDAQPENTDMNKFALSPRLNEDPDSVSLPSSDNMKRFKESEASDSEVQSDEDFFDEEVDLENIESLYKIASGWNTSAKSKKTKFPSASAFADALESDPYHGFDIMDFNRPSLRKKAKGRKGPPDLMLSDSELEMELEKAWRNDREKKKSKKQKREELRSQGLLGRSIGRPDFKSNLPLPPINKQLRKLVHDMANALSLKSHSRGKGPSRFPILYKTSRASKYNQHNISQADKILSHGRFRHRTIKTGDQSAKKSAKTRDGRPDTSVSYMDGDIVGASAPEIGAENKGRAMLEKMGWSSGTALGATNNKGILLPVAHVVKKSKAGLG